MRIIVGTYAFRYPLGGMVSWNFQWVIGLKRLGHDVYVFEASNYDYAWFDPVQGVVENDARPGLTALMPLLQQHDLQEKYYLRQTDGTSFGLSDADANALLRDADLFIDLGTFGVFQHQFEGQYGPTVYIDGEPGYTQMREILGKHKGEMVDYRRYYSNGAALEHGGYIGPDADKFWWHVWNPVVCDLFADIGPPPENAPVTTVMNWTSHDPLIFEGRTWRQKDVEFDKFIDLPARISVPAEVAVGNSPPVERLRASGWRVIGGMEATASYEIYRDYIASSLAEFSVCKEGYVALNTGWFSDRSAAYLGAGRPVVMQDTGFGQFLPTGEGLFAAATLDEAVSAIDAIASDPQRHCAAAREIAREHLDGAVVLPRFLEHALS